MFEINIIWDINTFFVILFYLDLFRWPHYISHCLVPYETCATKVGSLIVCDNSWLFKKLITQKSVNFGKYFTHMSSLLLFVYLSVIENFFLSFHKSFFSLLNFFGHTGFHQMSTLLLNLFKGITGAEKRTTLHFVRHWKKERKVLKNRTEKQNEVF